MTVLVISPDNMKFSLKSMQLDTTIDLQEMIGKRTRLTISKLGDFTRRDVIDTVRLAGLAASAGQRDLIRFHTYPAKPVKVGEKWSSTRPDTTEVSGSKMRSRPCLNTRSSRTNSTGDRMSEDLVRGNDILHGKRKRDGRHLLCRGNREGGRNLFCGPGERASRF